MKNTMKIKSLLSFFVPAAMMSLAVAGCSDYDNGYSEQAIKFAQDFRKTFGDIDPEQDWNLAERGTVTVSTTKESEVKIYAKVDDEYAIVGDYEGVKGTRMLGFDMVEGTKEIVVTDGVTAQKTVPGGVVTFGGTRTVFEGTTNDVTVTKLTSDVEINGETFPQYRTSTTNEVNGMLATVPEMTNNLDKVTNDFSYVSTGSFIVYPFYWNTSSQNTLGLYYTDASGNYHEVDIYRTKDGSTGELWFSTSNTVADDMDGWSVTHDSNSSAWRAFQKQTSEGNDKNDPSGITAPFMEFWRASSIAHIKIQKEFTVSPNVECIVEVAARLRRQSGSEYNDIGNVTLTANNQSVSMTADGNCTKGVYYYDGKSEGNLYSNMDGTKKIRVKCKSDSNGKITVEWDINTNNTSTPANWFSFKDLTITQLDMNINNMTAAGTYQDPDPYNTSFPTTLTKGQGIKVDLPVGTKFGMYIKKTDSSGAYTFYSESQKNEADSRLAGYPMCYASTFYVGDQMFLGFEDWPGQTGGDFDLNDLVLAFSGAKPIIINEDPEKGGTWLVACEDLGGSFDIDYNDVVFSVEHISGKTKAKITPLAAGGTLASYIYFQDPWDSNRDKCFGEIHQLFGATKVNSGEYTIINAQSRYEKTAAPIEFDVAEDWTMAYYATGDGSGSGYTRNGKDVNMGGFEIRTLTSGSDAPFTLDINSSAFSGASKIQASVRDEGENVPYILCIPYPYTRYNYPEAGKKTDYVWAWPVEYMTICDEDGNGPYPDFRGWVQNHNNNTDWYKNKNNANYSSATVEDMILSTGDMTQEEINANNGGGGTTQRKASQLGNKGDMVVHKANAGTGISVDLFANLTNANLSSGQLTYQYGHSGGDTNSPTQPLYSAGTRTITVTQAADDNYEAGSTTFKLTIVNDDEVVNNTQTYQISSAITSATFSFENGSNGKYNVKYNGTTTILTNVSSVKFSWSDISGNPMQIFTPWTSSSVSYVATNNQAGSKSYTISDNLWSTGESHEISLNPYGGSFTLTISGE